VDAPAVPVPVARFQGIQGLPNNPKIDVGHLAEAFCNPDERIRADDFPPLGSYAQQKLATIQLAAAQGEDRLLKQ
jgi:hypothetical protein